MGSTEEGSWPPGWRPIAIHPVPAPARRRNRLAQQRQSEQNANNRRPGSALFMLHPVYTIGHSNHAIERFAELLEQHAVAAACDVRSTPYSRMNPQFNRETLRRSLAAVGIDYLF